MKKSIVTFILIISSNLPAQVDKLFGIDISDFANTSGWTPKENEENTFYKNDVGNFERVFLEKDKCFLFDSYNPTGLVFYEVSNALKSQFGTEDINDDYFPDIMNYSEFNTPEKLVMYVSMNKAKIYRYWELPDKNYEIIFEFNKREFVVFVIKK